MNKKDRDASVTLGILEAIDNDSHVTQRHLAKSLGVALGLANSYLKRCVRKGWVKIQQAPANRYAYYLTPKGFGEKGRLTAQYLSYSFDFYRTASRNYSSLFASCIGHGWKTVLLCGVSELAEIASLRAAESDIEIIGYFDCSSSKDVFLGRPVWSKLNNIGCDAAVLTSLRNPSSDYQAIVAAIGSERVLIPDLLRHAVGEPVAGN